MEMVRCAICESTSRCRENEHKSISQDFKLSQRDRKMFDYSEMLQDVYW